MAGQRRKVLKMRIDAMGTCQQTGPSPAHNARAVGLMAAIWAGIGLIAAPAMAQDVERFDPDESYAAPDSRAFRPWGLRMSVLW